MSAIRKILVIVDPTACAPQAAVDKGGMLAGRCGAGLELVVCQPPAEAGDGDRSGRAARLLDDLCSPLLASGVSVERTVIHGASLPCALLAHAKACRADWVVKGTHSHRLSSRLLSRSTDWHLINDCPVPLLLTKPHGWATFPVVLAAIDPVSGDAESTRRDPAILDTAHWITQLLQGSLHVVHAYRPAADVRDMGGAASDPRSASASRRVDSECEERERQYAQVSDYVRRCRVSPQNLHVDMGIAASYLPRVALQEHADILVMGAGSPGTAVPVIHDGMAARVLDSLPCDMLVLK